MNNVIDLQTAYNRLKLAFRGKKETTVRLTSDAVQVTHYAATICIVKASGEIEIDNGGHETKTTKSHINLALETVGKKLEIFQKKGIWYFSDHQKFERHFKLTIY